jgi:eukaryotic-like serine/threonine-protein kinase
MTADEWRRIEAVYQAALAVPEPARAAYLAEACADDATLRREVKSLLAALSAATHGAFLETPALAVAAELTTKRPEVQPLNSGQHVGNYQVLEPLGAGAMGEVYRARDTKLGRDVALKLLPSALAADRDRLARFEREARVLAALNHPNIGAIYGIEDGPTASDGNAAPVLVLELVPGQTLAERIARGPLPVSTALGYACQMAEALDAAHEKGIVHRDLKPANIKVTPDGVVKILDFGLAKAVEPAVGLGLDASGEGLASPTVTVAGTRPGVVLGTAAYMSPEQARGQLVDKRTDIWAFGCVLFEMLTGRAAFARGTLTDTLTAILEHEPDWQALPAGGSPAAEQLLRRSWTKTLTDGFAILAIY